MSDYMVEVDRNKFLNTRSKLIGQLKEVNNQLQLVQRSILDLIKQDIKTYLSFNDVSGDNYEVTSVTYAMNDVIHIHLVYAEDGEHIDESFEDDKDWEEFTNRLASNYQVRLVSVI